MEQQFNTPSQTEGSITQEIKTKAPLLVIIIAWLMLLLGIANLFMTLLILLISPILGIWQLLVTVSMIITSFGVRRMRRWALYIFTTITILFVGLVGYSFLTSSIEGVTEFVTASVQVLALVYLWTISKKFV